MIDKQYIKYVELSFPNGSMAKPKMFYWKQSGEDIQSMKPVLFSHIGPCGVPQ